MARLGGDPTLDPKYLPKPKQKLDPTTNKPWPTIAEMKAKGLEAEEEAKQGKLRSFAASLTEAQREGVQKGENFIGWDSEKKQAYFGTPQTELKAAKSRPQRIHEGSTATRPQRMVAEGLSTVGPVGVPIVGFGAGAAKAAGLGAAMAGAVKGAKGAAAKAARSKAAAQLDPMLQSPSAPGAAAGVEAAKPRARTGPPAGGTVRRAQRTKSQTFKDKQSKQAQTEAAAADEAAEAAVPAATPPPPEPRMAGQTRTAGTTKKIQTKAKKKSAAKAKRAGKDADKLTQIDDVATARATQEKLQKTLDNTNVPQDLRIATQGKIDKLGRRIDAAEATGKRTTAGKAKATTEAAESRAAAQAKGPAQTDADRLRAFETMSAKEQLAIGKRAAKMRNAALEEGGTPKNWDKMTAAERQEWVPKAMVQRGRTTRGVEARQRKATGRKRAETRRTAKGVAAWRPEFKTPGVRDVPDLLGEAARARIGPGSIETGARQLVGAAGTPLKMAKKAPVAAGLTGAAYGGIRFLEGQREEEQAAKEEEMTQKAYARLPKTPDEAKLAGDLRRDTKRLNEEQWYGEKLESAGKGTKAVRVPRAWPSNWRKLYEDINNAGQTEGGGKRQTYRKYAGMKPGVERTSLAVKDFLKLVTDLKSEEDIEEIFDVTFDEKGKASQFDVEVIIEKLGL